MACFTLTRLMMLALVFLVVCVDITDCLLDFQGFNPLLAQNAISPSFFGQRPSLYFGFRSQRDHLLDNALNDLENRAFLTDNTDTDSENELSLPAENNLLDIGSARARQNEITSAVPNNRRLLLNKLPESIKKLNIPRLQNSSPKESEVKTESSSSHNQKLAMTTKTPSTKQANLPSFERKTSGQDNKATLLARGLDRLLNRQAIRNRIQSNKNSGESSRHEPMTATSQKIQSGTRQLKRTDRKMMIQELLKILARGNDKDFLRFILRIFLRKMQQKKRKEENVNFSITTLQPSSTVKLPQKMYVNPGVQHLKQNIPTTYSSPQQITTPVIMMKKNYNRVQYVPTDSTINERKAPRQVMNVHLFTSYVTDPSTRYYNSREISTQQPTTTQPYAQGNSNARARYTRIRSQPTHDQALTRSITPVTIGAVPLNQASNYRDIQKINKVIDSPTTVQNGVSNIGQGQNVPFIQSSIKNEFNWISSDNKQRTHKGVSEIKVNSNALHQNKRKFSHSMKTSIQSNPKTKIFDLKMNHSFQM